MIAALGAAACGDAAGPGAGAPPLDATPEPKLSGPERELLQRAQLRIAAYCAQTRVPLPGGQREVVSARRRAEAAADQVIELAGSKSTAEVEPGVDLRLLLSDLAEDLEGANCAPRLQARVEVALAAIPPS